MHTKNILHGHNSPISSSLSEDATELSESKSAENNFTLLDDSLHVEYHLSQPQENQSAKSFFMQTKKKIE